MVTVREEQCYRGEYGERILDQYPNSVMVNMRATCCVSNRWTKIETQLRNRKITNLEIY